MTLPAVAAALVFVIAIAVWWRVRLRPDREHAFALNRAWFTTLSDGASEYALVVDLTGKVLFASRSIERVLGISPAEIVGRDTFTSDKHPDDVDGVRDAYRRALSSPSVPQTAEFRSRHRDGHWVNLVGTCRNLLHDPQVRGIVVNVRDVTAERRIASELAATERQFRELLDRLPLMVYSVEPTAPYRPLFVSRGQEMLGYTHEEWMETRRWMDALHPDDRERVLSTTIRALEGQQSSELEYRMIDKQGGVRWLHDRGGIAFRPDGTPSAWLGARMDVTERVEAARSLKESEERYRSTFEDSVAANFVVTPGGKLLACNRAFLQLFGFTGMQHALEFDMAGLHPAPEARRLLVDRVRRDLVMESQEVELRRLDGRPIHVIENARGVADERGEITEIHGYLLDVTERRRLADELRQAQKMEAVGRLAGGIAHDFNNLLSVIESYASLLLADAPAEGAGRTDLMEIRRAVERGARLTRQLLTFSRFRIPEVALVDVDAVLRETESMVRRLLGPECMLSLQLGAHRQRVLMDAGQLDQVVVNLLVNASDAMPQGGQISVTTAIVEIDVRDGGVPELTAGSYIRIDVRDNGPGMDATTAMRAIEPFFTTKEVGRGTGLGLSIVFGIVTQAGGRMTIDSKPGRGTEVTLLLPVKQEESAEPRSAAPSPGMPPAAAARVLVVDDDEGVRATLGRILQRSGFAVTVTGGGEEAIRAWKTSASGFDLVITDLRMPEMNGRDLMKRLHELDPALPVLAMSGYPEDNSAMPPSAGAPLQFIAKPFSMDEVLARVRELTAGR